MLCETHNRFYLDISQIDTAGILLRSINNNFTQEAVQKLVVDLNSLPVSTDEPLRKMHIELNKSIFAKVNNNE